MSGLTGKGQDDRQGYAEKFAQLLQRFPHPSRQYLAEEGQQNKDLQWRPIEVERATGGRVSSQYFVQLRNGDIKSPGHAHLRAISQVMRFPFELWNTEPEEWDSVIKDHSRREWRVAEEVRPQLAKLLDDLMSTRKNIVTGQSLTNFEISVRTRGLLTDTEVEELRSGRLKDPTIDQILALSSALGVEATYWAGPKGQMPHLDGVTLEALADPRIHLAAKMMSELDDGTIDSLLTIINQMAKNASGEVTLSNTLYSPYRKLFGLPDD